MGRYGETAYIDDAGEEGENIEACAPFQYHTPADLSDDYIRRLLGRLLASSYREPHIFQMHVLRRACLLRLLADVKTVLFREQTLIDVKTPHDGQTHVFGDIHGDIHSLAEALHLSGLPSATNVLVFAGDCVDRGSWGVEVFVFLFALKLWKCDSVFLLRGNHETTGAMCRYGFQEEVDRKLGSKLYKPFTAVFRELPCGALLRTLTLPNSSSMTSAPIKTGRSKRKTRPVRKRSGVAVGACDSSILPWYMSKPLPGERRVLVCHGGLFRAWSVRTRDSLTIGTLEDLAKADRRDDDPFQSVIEDVLWSDPQVSAPDVALNKFRGAGILFGRGAVENFFRRNGVHGLIRGHEGPDMRERRPEMGDMMAGFSVDIELVHGFVVTVFSSANYRK